MSDVLAAAEAAGRAAGQEYREHGTVPQAPSFTAGSLLARKAATAWHRGFSEGRQAKDSPADLAWPSS